MTVKILSVGAAVPGLRLPVADIASAWRRKGGKGQLAVCASDEDVLTLSWEAGTRALAAAGVDGAEVAGLWWGTTRPPFAEGPSHAVLARTLNLGVDSGGALFSGSQHAGMDALLGASAFIGSGGAGYALVICADALIPGLGTGYESRVGAGAVAVLLGATGGTASLGECATRTRPLLDRYRGDRETSTRDLYDPRLFREEIFLPEVIETARALIARQAANGSQITGWSVPDPDGRLGAAATKKLGATEGPVSSSAFDAIGDTGAAAALIGAVGALGAPGTLGVVGRGGGRVTAVAISVDSPVPGAAQAAEALNAQGRTASYTDVLRARGQLVGSGETVPMGVPPESAMFVRGADEMLGALGGRCVECGTINTPPSVHPHCLACGADKMELVPLARRGIVQTYVVNHTMPAPFEAPLPIAVLDLDDGARIILQVDDDGSNVSIGCEMELVLRRYATDRGVPVYGYKGRPVRNTPSVGESKTAASDRAV